jgi:hypothetical protein
MEYISQKNRRNFSKKKLMNCARKGKSIMSSWHKNPGKRWIRIDGKKREWDKNQESGYRLLPWIGRSISTELIQARPLIHGHKMIRDMKDRVYNTWVVRHIAPRSISGNYVGLAAAYIPEIYSLLSPWLQGHLVSCQKHRADYKSLLPYMEQVKKVYREADLRLVRTDIFNYMQKTRNQYSLIDLDLMCTLNEHSVYSIYEAIIRTTANTSAVAVWHTSGRVTTDTEIQEVWRPLLFCLLDEGPTEILDYTQVDYFEGYPMRCDLFTLQRRRHV